MICSKCGANMPDSNKFCVRCGNKLESACPRCGTVFKSDAKFCVKCGMKRDSQPEQQEMPAMQPASSIQETPAAQPAPTQQETPAAQPAPAQQETPAAQPAPVQQETPAARPASAQQETPAAQPASIPQGTPAAQSASAAQPASQQVPPTVPQPAKQKKSAKNPGPIILIIVLLLLVIALAGGYTYFVKVLGKNPIEVVKEMISSDEDRTEEKDRKDSPKDKDADDGGKTEKEEGKKEEIVKGDVTLLEPAGKLAEQAGQQLAAGRYAESDGAIATADEALQLYMSAAEANHLEEEAKEGIVNTFQIYSDSVIGYCDMIKQQGAYVEGFNEISNKLSQAMELLTTVTQKGYTVDGKALEAYKTALIPEFRDTFIESINSFTERENWSRDEAWSYAERAYAIKENGKPLLFSDTDLEDPLRMRYVYCLAWITRKRCETGLKDGSMGYTDAVNSMTAILKETDYNLLLLQDIITYGSVGVIDVTPYRDAYNAIVDKIKSEQGLTIGTDIAVNSTSSVNLNHFWYFNDLDGEDKYKVDLRNGTTAATREWIRSNIPVMLGE